MDNAHVFWDYHGFSYHWLRTGIAALSSAVALTVAYPF